MEADVVELAKTFAVLGTAGFTLYKLGRVVTNIENATSIQNLRMDRIEKSVEKMSETVTSIAVEKTRLDLQSSRLDRLERWWDELRHGEGMVLPLQLNSANEVKDR